MSRSWEKARTGSQLVAGLDLPPFGGGGKAGGWLTALDQGVGLLFTRSKFLRIGGTFFGPQGGGGGVGVRCPRSEGRSWAQCVVKRIPLAGCPPEEQQKAL